jgi:S-DNA-T family DNA segregation ATPase FtsK/SpoIIIE
MTKRATRAPARPPRSSFQLSAAQLSWIGGLFLLAVALLTLLSLLSRNTGLLTTLWLDFLQGLFGLGTYLIPLGLTALGIWIIMLGTEHPLAIAWTRVLGVLLLFLAALAFAHHLAPPERQGHVARLGGQLGALLSGALAMALGWGGALVVLITVVGIGLSLALDIEFAEVVADTVALWQRLRAWLRRIHIPWPQRHVSRPPSLPLSALPRPAPLQTPRTPPRPGQPATASTLRSAQAPAADIAPMQPLAIGATAAQPVWTVPAVPEVLAEGVEAQMSLSDIREKTRIIEETLGSLGVPVTVVEVNPGPAVTQFGLEPGYTERRDRTGKVKRVKVKVSRIASLSNDLALALAASPIRIETPVPGKGIVGLEVPNAEIATVDLRSVIESPEFRQLEEDHLAVALGRDVSGTPVVADLAKLPHLLIAGATGSGKSVCINTLIACLILRNTPESLKLLMVDPKRVELSTYNGIPHLLAPVVVEADRVVGVLNWVAHEMDRRYKVFARVGARNIGSFNQMAHDHGESRLPFIVVFIDELADLMMVAPDEVERSICRIAQMARATGIHLVVATQRPSVDVVTGLIKANFPARISFAVSSAVDSRVVLDTPGAEKLLGRGDCLYMAPDSPKLSRVQGCYVSDEELGRLVSAWKAQTIRQPGAFAGGGLGEMAGASLVQRPLWPEAAAPGHESDEDPLLQEAIKLVQGEQRASVSFLQRRLRIGYSRASRLVDILEAKGIVGAATGTSKLRDVLIGPDEGAADAAPPNESIS